MLTTRNQRMAAALGIATALGMIISMFAWNDLAHSAYVSAGYLTFDEMLSVLWLIGFGVYLTLLTAMMLSAAILLTVVAPAWRWIERVGG